MKIVEIALIVLCAIGGFATAKHLSHKDRKK